MADTFILYRILGNDLPPRHGARQTLENVRFILRHEPAFGNCEKRWVLNRIADPEREAELIREIEAYGQSYVRIPFEIQEYASCFLDSSDLPRTVNPLDILNGKEVEGASPLSLEWLYRRKNLYAININGARNAAVEDGIEAGATWIMPFDGGCFLTANGFAGIVDATRRKRDARYVIVPMERIRDNAVLLTGRHQPRPQDEPQIVVHRDAADLFGPELRYGHRNKAELLRILGVPGPWHGWRPTPWEGERRGAAQDRGRYVHGGWVARLATQASATVEKGDSQRWTARFEGLVGHCAGLDLRVLEELAVRGDRLGCYAPLLASVSDAARGRIVEIARSLMEKPPLSVTDKAESIPGTEWRDYVSVGRYWHKMVDGSYVRRDGESTPASIRGMPEAEAFDRYRLQDMIEAVVTLAVAYEFTGDRVYGEKAFSFLSRWFLEPETRMNPHARFAQIKPDDPTSPSPVGILDFRDFWPLLDVINRLQRAGFINDDADGELKRWFRGFQDFLVKRGAIAGNQVNNVGVLHDVVAGAIAAYLLDNAALVPVLNRASVRLSSQMRPWGWLPAETARTLPLHYSLFALHAMMSVAFIGRANGMDGWLYSGHERRSLPMGIRFLATNRRLFGDYAERSAHFDDRIELACRLVPDYAADFEALADLPRQAVEHPEAIGADEGLPPLWALLVS